MPVIPTDFQVGRSPFAGGDLRTEASPAAFAAPGEAAAQAGEKAATVGASFADRYAEANRQQEAARLTFQGIGDLQQSSFKWSKVPNAEQAVTGFNADAEQIRGTTAAQSADPEVQALVSREILSHSTFLGLETQRGAFNMQASQVQGDLATQLDGYAKMAATQDPVTRASTVDKATAAIKGAVAAGWIYPAEGAKRQLAFGDQVWGDAVRQGLQQNPGPTLADLKAGVYDSRLSIPMRRELQPQIDRAEGQALGNGFYGAVAPRVQGSSSAPIAGATPGEQTALADFRQRESSGNYSTPHPAPPLTGSASGGYGIVDGTWKEAAAGTGLGTQFEHAYQAPPAVQDANALWLYRRYGPQPWAASAPGAARSMGQASAPPALDDVAAELYRRTDLPPGDPQHISENVADLAVRQATKRYTEWKQATNTARAALVQNLNDGIAALGAGHDWQPPANMGALLPPEQVNTFNRKIGEARDAGQARGAVEFASPDETATLQARAQARLDQPAAPDFARNQRYAQQLDAAIAARDKRRDADPAAFVASSPVVQAATAQARAAQGAGGTLEPAIAASLAEQDRVGVPEDRQRVLSKPDAASLVQEITKADPATNLLPPVLDQISRSYGRYWNRAFGDLVKAGLPAQYQVLASMDHPEQIVAAGDMQRMLGEIAQKGGVQKLKDTAPADQVKAIDQGLPQTMARFRATVRDRAQFAVWNDAVKNLAIYYAYRGDPDPLGAAYKGVIDSRYEFDGALRAPKGQLATVEAAGSQIQNAITPADLGPVPGNPRLTPAERQGIYADAIRSGFWATNESDDGAFLMLRYRDGGMHPARKADGSRVEFKFADAAGIVAKAQPAALPAATAGAVP